jgi:hypothetical protein
MSIHRIGAWRERARDEHRAAFARQFGRRPRRGDPMFWDPAFTDRPVPVGPQTLGREAIGRLMESQGAPDMAYVFRKTGLVRQGGVDLEPEEVAVYDAALEEWAAAGGRKADVEVEIVCDGCGSVIGCGRSAHQARREVLAQGALVLKGGREYCENCVLWERHRDYRYRDPRRRRVDGGWS